MTIKHYQSNEAAYEVFAEFDQRFQDFFKECEAFAAQFDGRPIIRTDAVHVQLAGVKLNNWPHREDAPLWRKPDRRNGDLQSLRTGRGVPRELREESARLHELWSQAPAPLDREYVWEALGLDWGTLLFTGIRHIIDHGARCVWIKTSATIAPEYATEVLGSEFERAVDAIKQAERDNDRQ